MNKEKYIHATEIKDDLGISTRAAYHLAAKLNEQLKTENPQIVIFPGNVPRKYYNHCIFANRK